MRQLLALIVFGLGFALSGAVAQDWGGMATISSTMGVQANRLCVGEATRGDLGCPTYSPGLSTSGDVSFTGGLTTSYISLTTLGTTWGYLGAASSYIPNLASNAISTTNISLSTINGISVSALGGGASPTNVPSFRVSKGGTNQTVVAGANTKLTFSTKTFDTTNNFNTSTSRFTPNVAGNYIFVASAYCSSTAGCLVDIYKNGAQIGRSGQSLSSSGEMVVATTAIIPMNGTSDYVEVYANSASTTISGADSHTFFAGSLLASGNGLISGTGVTALSALSDVNTTGAVSGSLLSYDAGQSKWVALASTSALGDRITSGTQAAVIANSTGTISFTTGGVTATSYMRSTGQLVTSGVSTTGAISASTLNVTGRTTLNGGLLLNQGSSAMDNLIYAGGTSAGSVDASFGFFVAGVGSNGSGQGPYFLGRGNDFSNIANQRGNLIFVAGDPSGPAATEGSIQFWSSGEVRRMIVDNAGNVGIGNTASAAAKLDVSGTIRMSNSGESCDASHLGSMKYATNQFYICRNGTAWETLGASGSSSPTDRITSGTLSVTANSATSIISLTTGSTTWGYLSSAVSYLPNLTTGSISATTVQVSGTTATCNSTNSGSIRYTSSTTTLELCTGTAWQPIGVGIPAGTISAFASSTCPTGWSEYTAARGRFLRGIDNSAGNDADGNRAPGSTQVDSFQGHQFQAGLVSVAGSVYNVSPRQEGGIANTGAPTTLGAYGTPRISSETRPKNVAVTFCQFNGTSNGWNNPLSGGSTVPGGATTQIQYNTAGSFDGNAGLTWTNATQTLAATNIVATGISTTNISLTTINGVPYTGSGAGTGYAITSGTTSITVNTGGYTSLTTAGTTWGYLSSATSYIPNLGTNAISTTNISLTSINGLPIGSFGASPTIISGTTSMVPNWPDAIQCTLGGNSATFTLYLAFGPASDNQYYYRSIEDTVVSNSVKTQIVYTNTGNYSAFSSTGGYSSAGNCAQSISSLYAAGRAFNFLGSTSTGGLGYALTSGTLSVTANSATSVVSFTTAGTTWGYAGSTASYLPNLSSNAISTTNISLTTINGQPLSSFATSGSQVAFFVTKGGTDQAVTSDVVTKVTWSTKVLDTTNSFNTSTSRFQPSIPGYYLMTAQTACSNTTGYCALWFYKNGTSRFRSYVRGNNPWTGITDIIYLNGSTDYVELWGIASSGNTILGDTLNSMFQGILVNGMGSGSGVSSTALSGLNDVALTNPVSGSSLVYDAGQSKWVNTTSTGGLGYALTSGTLSVTANSNTSIVSFTTAGTTWGYLGSTASYIPSLSTNVLTVGGLTITSSSLVSTTAQVAFSVNKGGTNQTVTANTNVKLTWSTKLFDTNNNFSTATSRFTPTVAGYYQLHAKAYCTDNTAFCQVLIYKNGVLLSNGFQRAGTSMADTNVLVNMNGSTDYSEVYVVNSNGTTVSGGADITVFEGYLINGGGSGSVSGTSTGVSALASLTDVSASAPANNSLLRYNSTSSKWEAVGINTGVSTTSMIPNWPDSLVCTMGGTADVRVFTLAYAPLLSDGRYYYRTIEQGTNAYTQLHFNADGSFYNLTTNAGYTGAGNCAQSISQLYAAGRAFNFIGNNGGTSTGGLGYALTSGTLSVTANSNTSIVSFTTAGTTWGYAGSTASYLPNFSSNAISATNISATTINGISISSLGGAASPTNVPSFRVNKNGTNQTVTASSYIKVTFSTKDFDTFNNFDTSTNRYTPKIAGNYLFNGSVYCYTGTSCGAYIYKNGVMIAGSGSSSLSDPIVQTSMIIPMNGTTDYIELYVYMVGSTTLNGAAYYTYLEGSLLASGNGTISGSTAGVSALASLTDVSASAPANNSLLRYNSTSSKWEAVGINAGVSTTTMVSNWPDAIQCTLGGVATNAIFYASHMPSTDGYYYYRMAEYLVSGANVYTQLYFNGSGAYQGFSSSNSSWTSAGTCASASISALYASGKAFNFIGNNGGASTGGLGSALTSGTLSVTANSNTSIVSFTTAGTTWGYAGSTASYLPNLSSNAISTTNISVTTINGQSLSSFGTASPTNVPAFRVNKNGTNQTVTTGTWTKLTWSTKEFDTFNNFDTSTSRYTPTVAGNYIFTTANYCGPSATGCWSGVYKNGVLIAQSGLNGSGINNAVAIIPMNGTTDYVEAYTYSAGSTTIDGTKFYTYFQGSLVASGNGTISGTGAGVSALASLTDVSASAPANNSLLRYNSTSLKWESVDINAGVSTTTIFPNWPDAITCNGTAGNILLTHSSITAAGIHYYTYGDANTYAVTFTSAGAYNSAGGTTWTNSCVSKSITQLYASGQAFNFIGNNGGASTGGLGSALTSGTLSVTANSNTSIVSFTTAGTTWGYAGSTASYLPNFSSNAISTTNISATTINGIAISSLGSGGSGTAVAFRVNRNNTNQSITAGSWTKVLFTNKEFDTGSNFNTTTSRFTPTTAGYYMLTGGGYCQSSASCLVAIYKNGTSVMQTGYDSVAVPNTQGSTVIYMNGTTDYAEFYINSGTGVMDGTNTTSFFAGALISGGGSGGGGGSGTTTLSGLTDVNVSSPTSGTVLTYNGTSAKWEAMAATGGTGGTSSPTNVPAFRANKNGADQSLAASTWTKLTFGTKDFDTYTNYDTGTSRFTPTIAGYYYITGSLACGGTSCYTGIYKNGALHSYSGNTTTASIVNQASALVYMNGTTDYLELWGYTASTAISGNAVATYFTGTLVASGNGLVSSTGAGLGDRITSGTTSVTAYTNTSVSIVTNNTERVVIGTSGNVGIGQQPATTSALAVSGTTQANAVKLNNNTADACTAATYNTIKVVNNRPYFCVPR